MTAPVALYHLATSEIAVGGTAVTVAYGQVAGGVITNPSTPAAQGLATVEVLYLDPTGAAAELRVTETTIALQPGQSYFITPGQTTSISVNAASSGHLFSGIIIQPPTQYPPTPQVGAFPPSAPTTLTQILPSYLYEEYADDDDLQALVAAYNTISQRILSWFALIGLPVYTNPQITGPLLDWVANGLYGILRPSLSSGKNRDIGPFDTYAYDTLGYNVRKIVGPNNVTVTSDDVFKRIITWNFYKGDGNTFNVRWLKRRIMRFLLGTNGSAPNIDQTYIISVTYGPGIISIRLSFGTRMINGGALYGRCGFNTLSATYNSLQTTFNSGTMPPPFAAILKEAIESGVLILPFQYAFACAV